MDVLLVMIAWSHDWQPVRCFLLQSVLCELYSRPVVPIRMYRLVRQCVW